jgi:hypothetical protein
MYRCRTKRGLQATRGWIFKFPDWRSVVRWRWKVLFWQQNCGRQFLSPKMIAGDDSKSISFPGIQLCKDKTALAQNLHLGIAESVVHRIPMYAALNGRHRESRAICNRHVICMGCNIACMLYFTDCSTSGILITVGEYCMLCF